MTIEIVDLPSYKMVIFQFAMLVHQRVPWYAMVYLIIFVFSVFPENGNGDNDDASHGLGFGVHDFQTYTHGMVGTCWY